MTTPTRLKIYGPPGSGKTRTALNMVSDAVVSGDKAIFTSFTKQAANEARFRVPKEHRENIQVSTLHSLTFKDLNYRQDYVLNDLTKFSKHVGEVIEEQEDKTLPKTRLKEVLSFLSTWRNKRVEPTLSDLPKNIPWKLSEFIINEYRKFKHDEARVDYTDFLTSYIKHGEPLKVQHMFVDEAQDLTALQWRVINKMSRNCDTLAVFGDDDQAIFAFAGSEAENLMGWTCDATRTLDKSHRLPKQIYLLSQDVIKQVQHRYNKEFQHNGDIGQVSLTSTINFDIDFTGYDNYAVLYRNKYVAQWVKEELHRRGVPYICEDGPWSRKDDIAAIVDWERWRSGKPISVRSLRNIARFTELDLSEFDLGGSLKTVESQCPTSLPWHEIIDVRHADVYRLVYNKFGMDTFSLTPKITLSTIHHAKGGEWDKVILLTDMTKLTYDEYIRPEGKENEHRVWYVGTTRAKKHLQLIRPQKVRHYPLLANYPLERLL